MEKQQLPRDENSKDEWFDENSKDEWFCRWYELKDTQNEIQRIEKGIAKYQELIAEKQKVLKILKVKLEAIE